MGKRNPNTDKAAAKDKGPDISDFIVAEEELKTLKKQQGIPDSSENLNALGRAIDYILTARERRIKQPIKKKNLSLAVPSGRLRPPPLLCQTVVHRNSLPADLLDRFLHGNDHH